MQIRFGGTHFVDEMAFMEVIKTDRATILQYNKKNGGERLIKKYLLKQANWRSVGQLDNVFILDSGFGKTDQDRKFIRSLKAFAKRNGVQLDTFHRYSPKRFDGQNNILKPSGEIDLDNTVEMVDGKYVPAKAVSGAGNPEFLTLDEVVDLMRPLHNQDELLGYMGSVWKVADLLWEKLTGKKPDA